MKRGWIGPAIGTSLALVSAGAHAEPTSPDSPAPPAATTPAVSSEPAPSSSAESPSASPPSSPDEPTPSPEPSDDPSSARRRWKPAWEFGLRTGYGIPFGSADGSSQMGDVMASMVPLWFDVGYRFSPLAYGGIYFQYGFGSLNTDAGKPEAPCAMSTLSCSTNDVRIGAELDFHLLPFAAFDPWVALGVGVEVTSLSVSGPGGSGTVNETGLEIVNLQVGGNWNATPALAVGYFVSFSVGQFNSISTTPDGGTTVSGDVSDKALHEWLLLGIRGTYSLRL